MSRATGHDSEALISILKQRINHSNAKMCRATRAEQSAYIDAPPSSVSPLMGCTLSAKTQDGLYVDTKGSQNDAPSDEWRMRPRRHYQRTITSRSVRIQYDENGRFTPREPRHLLSVQELKNVRERINALDAVLVSSSVSSDNVETITRNLMNAYEALSRGPLSELLEDAASRCEFAGGLLKKAVEIISVIVCKLVDAAQMSSLVAKQVIAKSVDDMKNISEKVEAITRRPPVHVEREVIIEVPVEKAGNEKQVSGVGANHVPDGNVVLQRSQIRKELSNMQQAKQIWQTAATELCRLSIPMTHNIFDRQTEWAGMGRSFIETCRARVTEVVDPIQSISDRWNLEGVQACTLACRAQSAVIAHMSIMQVKCGEIAGRLADSFSQYHAGIGLTHEEYHEMLMAGDLPDLHETMRAWSAVLSQWMDIDNSPVIAECRTCYLDLDNDFKRAITEIDGFPCKNLLPEDCVKTLTDANNNMSEIMLLVRKPCDSASLAKLKPVGIMLQDWGELVQEAVEGRGGKLTTMGGLIDPIAIRTFAQQLEAAADTLSIFCRTRIDAIKELQISIPKFTFDIRMMCMSLPRDAVSSVDVLSDLLDENVEIAAAWAFLHGAGVRGPFQSFKDVVVPSDFEASFSQRFTDWLRSFDSSLRGLLQDNALENFELLLKSWFAAARQMITARGQFFCSVHVQTDPAVVHSNERTLSECGSSSSFLPLKARVDSFIGLPSFSHSERAVVFEAAPLFLDFNPVKGQASQFAKTQPLLVAMNVNSSSMKNSGRHKTNGWVMSVLAEFFEFRLLTTVKKTLPGIAIFHNHLSVAASFASFAKMKYGIKKMIKQFESDMDGSIVRLCRTDPTLFCTSQFRSGEWSSHCFDFYLMCRSKLLKTARLDMRRFVESVFAPFGRSPLNVALSGLQLYNPTTRDELLCSMAASFNSILAGRRTESMGIFRATAVDGRMTLPSFLSVLERYRALANKQVATDLCELFSKDAVVKLSFAEFEVCALYSGIFREATVALKSDPIAFLTGSEFSRVKDDFASGAALSTCIQNTLRATLEVMKHVTIPDSDANEMSAMCVYAAQIAARHITTDPLPEDHHDGPTAATGPSPPVSPRHLLLRTDGASRSQTFDDLLARRTTT